MTIESRELFELCRRVYEATVWDDTRDYYHEKDSFNFDTRSFERNGEWTVVERRRAPYDIPLYTSDYLLEKLPVHLKEGTLSSLYELDEDGSPWCWGYHYDDKRVKLANGYYAQGWADTPLKALLNLVIKLDKGGVKL